MSGIWRTVTPAKLVEGRLVLGRTQIVTGNWMKAYAEHWLYERRRERVLAKRDAHRERMRQERMTAKAIGQSRRQGRL